MRTGNDESGVVRLIYPPKKPQSDGQNLWRGIKGDVKRGTESQVSLQTCGDSS
jgi:hypothetical protein